jgi:para-nitrobenzyl esterase
MRLDESAPILLQMDGATLLAEPEPEPESHHARVTVRIDSGRIEGVATDAQVAIFRGVPYATVERRWAPPGAVEPWGDSVRDASKFGPACMQDDSGEYMFMRTIYKVCGEEFPASMEGQTLHDRGGFAKEGGFAEDGLNLCVFAPRGRVAEEGGGGTPAAAAADPLPVMVWIHGGGYKGGYADRYDGSVLCNTGRGCVVVVINYRLGVFGFACHPELEEEGGGSCGNYGIMDQVAALQWVQRNARAFGGDPGKVTIFGESAGGGSVMGLLCTPLSAGLFHRAIAQSGGGCSEGQQDGNADPAADLAAGIALGAKLGRWCGGPASLAELRALPAEAVLEAAKSKKAEVKSFMRPDGKVFPKSILDTLVAGEEKCTPVPFLLSPVCFRLQSFPNDSTRQTDGQILDRNWPLGNLNQNCRCCFRFMSLFFLFSRRAPPRPRHHRLQRQRGRCDLGAVAPLLVLLSFCSTYIFLFFESCCQDRLRTAT